MIGLFGGAFDPPHNGHVALAQAGKRELGLDRLLVLVSANPGHKAVETPAGIRLELARAACAAPEGSSGVRSASVSLSTSLIP